MPDKLEVQVSIVAAVALEGIEIGIQAGVGLAHILAKLALSEEPSGQVLAHDQLPVVVTAALGVQLDLQVELVQGFFRVTHNIQLHAFHHSTVAVVLVRWPRNTCAS